MSRKRQQHYRVEIAIATREAVSEAEIRDAFTARIWSLEGLTDQPISTKVVWAEAERGSEFKT